MKQRGACHVLTRVISARGDMLLHAGGRQGPELGSSIKEEMATR